MAGLFEQQRSAMTAQVEPGPLEQSLAGLSDGPEALAGLEFERFEQLCGGVLGVSAVHIDDGRRLGFREQEAFPMASTFKVPLAALVLQRIDAGLLDPTQMVDIGADLRVPPPLIEAYFGHPGLAVSVANLLDIMLVTSDNGATDALLGPVGGPAAVMAAIEQVGVAGMRIDRSTSAFLADFLAFDVPASESFAAVFARLPFDEKARLDGLTERANDAYDDNARDSTSPAAMTQLLDLLWRGEILAPAVSRDVVRDDAPLRERRSLEGSASDRHASGAQDRHAERRDERRPDRRIARWRGCRRHRGVREKSRVPTPQRERAIAHAALTVYDYMLLECSATSTGSLRP